jgi:hypothetical protein
MSQQAGHGRTGRSRFQGTLIVGGVPWQVDFLEVARAGEDWVIECLVTGPRVAMVTIRCPTRAAHGDTARRVMDTLKGWLASKDKGREAILEVELDAPVALGKAS